MSQWTREDIEWAFIREFATGDFRPSEVHTYAARIERIRIAICREQRADLKFYDSDMTYAQAYRLWAGKPLELRRFPRDAIPSHREEPLEDDDEKDEDDY